MNPKEGKTPMRARFLTFGSFILAAALLGGASRAATLNGFAWADFERGLSYWTASGMGSLAVIDSGVSPDFPSEGKKGYKARFECAGKGGRLIFVTRQAGDLTGATAFLVDVYNSSRTPFQAFLIVKQGERWTWYESTKVDLKPGWNRDLAIRIQADPGPAPSGGAAVLKVPSLADIREAGLYLEAQDAGSGLVYIDHLRLVGADPSKVVRVRDTDVVTGTDVLLAGFEGSSPFVPDTAYSSATGTGSVELPGTTQGNRAGKFMYRLKSPDDKGAFQFESNLDLAKVSGVRFDVFVPGGEDMDTCFAVNTGSQWEYFESMLKPLKPGWNRDVTFPLQAGTYKSQASGWRNDTVIRGLSQTRKIMVYILPHSVGEGHVMVDNVRLVAADAGDLRKMLDRVLPPDTPLTGEDTLLDGFEKDPVRFSADSGWSGATGAAPSTLTATEGKRSLRCDFDIPKDKNASFGVEMPLDLSSARAVKADVYVPDETTLQCYLALNTGASYEWWESKTLPLRKGWNRDLTFRLDSPTFKAQSTGWQNNSRPRNLAKTKKLFIGFFSNQAVKGSVHLDHVRVTGLPPAALTGPRVRTLKGREVVWDPLQSAAKGWVPSTSATDNSFATVVYYERTEGARSVKLKYRTQSDSQKARYYRDEALDWTSVLGVRVDVYNPQDHPVNLGFAVQTGPNFLWHEAREVMVAPGWNRDLTIDLSSPQLKTQRSNWSNSDYLDMKDDIRSVSFIVYPNRAEEGSLVLSNLRTLERDPLGALGMPEAGRYVGGSSKTLLTGRLIRYDLVESFEQGTSAWQASAKARLSSSALYATEADRTLKVEYDQAGGDPPEFMWKVPAGFRDMGGYELLMFDVYNAGPPVQASVAFKSVSDDLWIESPGGTIATGWNRNMTVQLYGTGFKSARTAWAVGETFRNRSHVDEVHVKLTAPTGRGTLYFDRVQLGGPNRTNALGDLPASQTDSTVQQTLQLKVNPADAAQVKVEGEVVKTDSGPAIGSLTKARLDLRGYGNEACFSTGETLPGTDDPLALLDGGVLGGNLLGASEKFYALDTSLQAVGFVRYGDQPHTLGTSSGYALRVNRTFLEDYSLGGGVIGHRFGSRPGSNPLNAEVEADVRTAEVDFKGYLRRLNLSLEGEAARSFYETWDGSPYDASKPEADAYRIGGRFYVESLDPIGPLKFSASRTEMQESFFAPYAKTNVPGAYQHAFEVSWQADQCPPVAKLRKRGKFVDEFFNGFYVYTQVYTYAQRTSTYSNRDVRLVAQNYESNRLYYFMWWHWYQEGKDAGDASLVNPLLSTRLTTTTVNPELRYRLMEGLFANYHFRFSYTDYWEELSHAGGLSCRFWNGTWLTGDGRFTRKSGSRTGEFVNWYASLSKRVFENSVEAAVTYGAPSYVNYWKDEYSLKTVNGWAFSLSAKF
jgi:hypothetical protein